MTARPLPISTSRREKRSPSRPAKGEASAPGQQAHQGDDADRDRAAVLEAVDAEGDREAPAREGDPDPGDPEQAEVAVAEVDGKGTEYRDDFPYRSSHGRGTISAGGAAAVPAPC